ncbi:MAG: YmdB family metallophosphoesterase [Devosiaceae bacterium]|nr:YmdB family metallophosphoesterase [Devosiaceae bacterium MH13]
MSFDLLFLGDVVGRAGREAVEQHLPTLLEQHPVSFVVCNGENAAHGFGITETICDQLFELGVDVITLGNHSFDQRDMLVGIERVPNLLRPVTYPAGTPGRGWGLYKARSGAQVLVINAMGRIYMDAMEDPFAAVDAVLAQCPMGDLADFALVDFHAEATSEKQALGAHLDGRVTVVVGTHTHVPTSDHRVQPSGTAYQSDAGMCGDYESVLGMDKTEPLQRFLTKVPQGRFSPAEGEGTLCGLAVRADPATGLALACEPVRMGGSLSAQIPSFWR